MILELTPNELRLLQQAMVVSVATLNKRKSFAKKYGAAEKADDRARGELLARLDELNLSAMIEANK